MVGRARARIISANIGYAQHMTEPRSRLARAALIAALLALGAVVGWFASRRHVARHPALAPNEILADTGTVLVAVKNLARLESVSFHMERVIDLKERQEHLFGLLRADDAILLVAAGDVIAGVDLLKLRDGDVSIEPAQRRVHITLPAPELLTVRLDNKRTYVHSRKTDLLAKPGSELETRARQVAEESIRDAALDAGILTRARENAAQTLTALVRSLGYDHVTIDARGE